MKIAVKEKFFRLLAELSFTLLTYADHVEGYFLMSSPWPIIVIWLAYITFVLKWGPSYMSKRPAFELKNTLIAYNLFQVVLSCYFVYYGANILRNEGLLSSRCAIETNESRQYMIRGVYMYFLAKLSEFLDTIFFVLRKKTHQVSFLHVYHHSLMAIATWFALKYNPSDVLIFLGTLNCFVHVIMYAYYGLAAFPNLSKYLWWKKYITSLQLTQFGLITLHAFASVFISKCQTSYILLFTIFFNLGVMVYLFADFYVKSYIQTKNDRNSKKKIVSDKVNIIPSIVEAYSYENIKATG